MFDYVNKDGTDFRYGKIALHVIIVLVLLTFAFGSFGTVDAGTRGVETRLGKVVAMIQPGLYFKMPFLEHVTIMNVHTQSLTASGDTALAAASNDLQDTKLSVVVNYHIEPTTVDDIYVQYGDAEKYYTQVVDPLIIATIKATASQYTASDQIQKRAEMSDATLVALTNAFSGKNVFIEKADITNIAFSESFTQAIENKVTAVQNAEAAKNKLVQTQAEADQLVVTAKATAEAQRIQSASLAAQGGADYVALQAINKWDGHYPQTVVGGGTVPLISLK